MQQGTQSNLFEVQVKGMITLYGVHQRMISEVIGSDFGQETIKCIFPQC